MKSFAVTEKGENRALILELRPSLRKTVEFILYFHGRVRMKSGKVILVSCKRCDVLMLKYQRIPIELDITNPFPFDRVCGHCLTQKEVDLHYGRLKNRQKIV